MQAPSWGIGSALQNPREEAPTQAPHMLSHPSHNEYTQLAEMVVCGEKGWGLAWPTSCSSIPPPGMWGLAMAKTGWGSRENLVGYPSMSHWEEIRHASHSWEVSLRDVPERPGPSCCQRNHEKSELKAVINLYRNLIAWLLFQDI